jgi:hypothetical protein
MFAKDLMAQLPTLNSYPAASACIHRLRWTIALPAYCFSIAPMNTSRLPKNY